jgi:hypothetical protein
VGGWVLKIHLSAVIAFFVPFPPFASRFYPFIPHSPLGGLMGSFSFGVLEGVGDAVVITVWGGFSSDGVELVHVRLRGLGWVHNARVVMCRISLPGFPGFYFLYFVEEAVEDD